MAIWLLNWALLQSITFTAFLRKRKRHRKGGKMNKCGSAGLTPKTDQKHGNVFEHRPFSVLPSLLCSICLSWVCRNINHRWKLPYLVKTFMSNFLFLSEIILFYQIFYFFIHLNDPLQIIFFFSIAMLSVFVFTAVKLCCYLNCA